MTLQSSGAISLSNIAGEFGGSTPHSLSEYYRGGGLVQSHSGTAGIPSSGTISFNQFYGKTATAPVDNVISFTVQTYSQGTGKNVFTVYGANGSMSDGSVVTNNGTALTVANVEMSSFGIVGISFDFGGGNNSGSAYYAYNTGAIRGVIRGGVNRPFTAPATGANTMQLRGTTPNQNQIFNEAAADLAYMQGQNGNNISMTFTY